MTHINCYLNIYTFSFIVSFDTVIKTGCVHWLIDSHLSNWSSDLTQTNAANFVCYPPQTNSDKDVQFKDNSRWGHRQAITASAVLPFTFCGSWQAKKLLPWMNALKRSRTQPGVKITFSLMTNLKQATLDMCKSTARRCVRSVEQELGDFHFGWYVFLTHSWLCLCSCCRRYFDQCQHGRIRARSVFADQNLAGVGGYTQSLQLIQVIQELTLGFCYWWTMCCAAVSALAENFTWNFCYNKGKFY